jgi:sulfur-carrier protein
VVTVRVPGLLADQAGGQKEFEVEAPTVREALEALPVRDLLFDERGELRPLVNVYVDGEDARWDGGVTKGLAGDEELLVVQAVAGGADLRIRSTMTALPFRS